jgi:hypothetical protein
MSFMPGGKCMKQSDEEGAEEYAMVQALLPLFKKCAKERRERRRKSNEIYDGMVLEDDLVDGMVI